MFRTRALSALVAASLVSAAAFAAPPPVNMHPELKAIAGAVAYDTTLAWNPSTGAASYHAWWRETTAPQWQHAQGAEDADSVVLKNVILDDFFFGVSAVSRDGRESPVEFPGFAGSFARSPKLGPDGQPTRERYPSLFGKFGGEAVGPASWQTGTQPPPGRAP